VEHRVCHITSIYCGLVVQLVVTACCTTNAQQTEVVESDTIDEMHVIIAMLLRPVTATLDDSLN